MAWCLDHTLQLLVHIYYHIDNHIKVRHIVFHVVGNQFPLYFVQYSVHQRIFQITYAHLNAIYITHHEQNLLQALLEIKNKVRIQIRVE